MDLSTIRVRPPPPLNVRGNSPGRVALSEENGPGGVRAARGVRCRRATDVFQLLQVQPPLARGRPHGEKTAGTPERGEGDAARIT